MAHFKIYLITCGQCGHRNRLDKSPRVVIRKILVKEMRPCIKCKAMLSAPEQIGDSPLVRMIHSQLKAEGITPTCKVINRRSGKALA